MECARTVATCDRRNTMRRNIALIFATLLVGGCSSDEKRPADLGPCDTTDGQCIFRHDTFGDEQLWTDMLRLHEVAQTLSPKVALSVGLKVDAEAVPPDVLASADLDAPATTVA